MAGKFKWGKSVNENTFTYNLSGTSTGGVKEGESGLRPMLDMHVRSLSSLSPKVTLSLPMGEGITDEGQTWSSAPVSSHVCVILTPRCVSWLSMSELFTSQLRHTKLSTIRSKVLPRENMSAFRQKALLAS